MRNIKKHVNTCLNNVTDCNLQLVINGQFKETIDKEDLEFMRFMIGGMGAK
ncbi:hypothetical protein RE476_02160 [Methanolobus mangrovi]|uniref:Uncharacterized protein n=1 Tax=Methanolobus mangrovi TaxID=3072977 RepID=A0AA51UIA8_9EURY|nr:hypothetical protein [Methanolobus mangrovi]WMW22642.1 hypothetical protein RE476_02160 [Methanolobus mangrovi]